MKLEQGQVWKVGDQYLRIIKWARMSIGYQEMESPDSKEGENHLVTKKDFCRLIKEGVLEEPSPEGSPPADL